MWAFLKLVALALVAVLLLVAAIGGIGWGLYRQATGPGPLREARTLVIPPHTGLADIAKLLAQRGVIRYPLSFEFAAAITGQSVTLLAGEYEFPPGVSPMQAVDILASGKTVKHRLTIPEGLTSAEVVALVRIAPSLEGEPNAIPPEGALMPDTYIYSYGEERQAMLDRMVRLMKHEVTAAWAERRPDLPLRSPEQLVTLASLVERETSRADERARIASVFVNRLRLGMRLQSDPTVIYALSDGGARTVGHRLTRADLTVPSPYNTYLVKGLPPGPIDNPGTAALRAAARPAATDDLYFVADGSGGHVFAKTLAQHHRNVAEYRRGSASDPDGSTGVRAGAEH